MLGKRETEERRGKNEEVGAEQRHGIRSLAVEKIERARRREGHTRRLRGCPQLKTLNPMRGRLP